MNKIKIGKAVSVTGLKGELRVYHYTDYKERFSEIKEVYLENKKYNIEGVRYMKEMVILKLAGINDRNEAEKHRNKDIFIDESEKRVLPEDTYYISELLGLMVYDQNEKYLGELCDVIQNSSQDIYEIKMENGNKFMIPAVEEFIKKIDIEKKIMNVSIIEGLIE